MKLLNYTSARYLLFAALLLLISVPVFYIVLDRIFIHSVDKDLYEQSKEIPAHINAIKSERDLALWRELDNDLSITDADKITFHEKPFTEKKFIRREHEDGDFRMLQKRTKILGKDYIIQLESSMVEKEDLLKIILSIQLGLFFFLLLGAVGINYFINKNVWKPFYQSLAFLQQFNLENEIEESSAPLKIHEFRQLKQSVHQLTTSVRKAYISQKEFIENAAHELQTPLTNLKFKLELLLQEKGLSESQSLLISDMYKVMEQLDELNRNLLLLSKIENGQFASIEPVYINDLVNEVTDDLLLIAESKAQQVIKNMPDDKIMLYSNKILLVILVKNLALNALQYSDLNATVHITVDKNAIEVINPGMPLDFTMDKLFSRFNKNNRGKGNGLGLSIAKTIADLYHFRISYEYTSGNHHFTLRWPG